MKYICAITFFRTREKQLPDQTDFERMIAGAYLSKSFSVLQDTHYAPFLSDKKAEEFKQVFDEEKISFKKNLPKLGIKGDLIDFLYQRADFFNIGLYFKKELFNEGFSEEDFLREGLSDFEKLKRKYPELENKVQQQDFENPSQLDQFLTKFYFNKTIELAKEKKEKEIKQFFENYLKVLEKSYKLTKENKSKKNLLSLDKVKKRLDKLEKDFFQREKWRIEGLGPILAYFLKKRKTEKITEAILAGKQINLQNLRIKKLIKNLPVLL